MSMRRVISLLLIIVNLSFTIQLASAEQYTLAAGDVLEVKIVGQADLATKQTITPDGTISLPMLGRLSVSGLTLKQLDTALTSGFSKYINKPQVVVYLTPRPIYVVQHDQSKNTWDVKEAKSVAEAQAFLNRPSSSRPSSIESGAVLTVDTGTKPDWWQQNWYKIITATAVIAGVYVTLNR